MGCASSSIETPEVEVVREVDEELHRNFMDRYNVARYSVQYGTKLTSPRQLKDIGNRYKKAITIEEQRKCLFELEGFMAAGNF
jgi:hypothetical protein